MNPNLPRQAQVSTLELNMCATPACPRPVIPGTSTCFHCQALAAVRPPAGPERSPGRRRTDQPQTMADKYPKYYKALPPGVTVIDTYAVNQAFPVDDSTGCILHARKKLLIPGTRTGGKSMRDDVREARDTLTRYLELTEPSAEPDINVTIRT